MADSPAVQQAFPAVSVPLVGADGTITLSWYQFLVALWKLAGAADAELESAVYLKEAEDGAWEVYAAATNEKLGTIRANWSLAAGCVWIGNAKGVPTAVVLRGDISVATNGVVTVTGVSGTTFGPFATAKSIKLSDLADGYGVVKTARALALAMIVQA
jgi:hypothetical protein